MNIVIHTYRVILKELNKSNLQNKYFIKKRLKNSILLNKRLTGKQKNNAIDGLFFQVRNINNIIHNSS